MPSGSPAPQENSNNRKVDLEKVQRLWEEKLEREGLGLSFGGEEEPEYSPAMKKALEGMAIHFITTDPAHYRAHRALVAEAQEDMLEDGATQQEVELLNEDMAHDIEDMVGNVQVIADKFVQSKLEKSSTASFTNPRAFTRNLLSHLKKETRDFPLSLPDKALELIAEKMASLAMMRMGGVDA